MKRRFEWCLIAGVLLSNSSGAGSALQVTVDPALAGTNIDLTRYALGQGGLSDQPMFDPHIDNLRQLHPQTIRIFVQEFFNLYPEHGHYHWTALDKVIETIEATGAKPLLCLCFKPARLFPKIDQRLVHPADYAEWEELISQLVRHCNQERRFGIEYWEVANEPDIGEDGGCPYLFSPADYLTYYDHTVEAIRRADPAAKVGGPALAGYNSDIGSALIEHCGKGSAPLDFFSWHIYQSDPEYFRKSIREIKERLAKFSRLKAAETIIDEWNMSLDEPGLDPGFQPSFVLETTRCFLEEGLIRSAYYHIRDAFVDERQFAKFMSPKGAAFVARWWNDTPQYDGLYDNQGQVRPVYDIFKLLSLLKGQELRVEGLSKNIHALAVKNESTIEIVFWNFPTDGKSNEQEIELHYRSKKTAHYRLCRLEPLKAYNRLEIEKQSDSGKDGENPLRFKLGQYQVRWVTITP